MEEDYVMIPGSGTKKIIRDVKIAEISTHIIQFFCDKVKKNLSPLTIGVR